MERNDSQADPYDICSNLTLEQLEQIAFARGITGVVCFVLCLATFIFGLIYMCRLKETNTLQRLFLYLTFSTLLYVGVLSLHIEHKFRYSPETQHEVCQLIGFLDQYTGSVQLMFTVGITIAIFNSLFRRICSPYNALITATKPHNKQKKRRVGYFLEVAFIIVCFVLPALFAWIPFLLVPYGETGPWCWIESTQNGCHKSRVGYLEQILLWYVPFTLVSVFSFLCVISIILYFIYVRCRLRSLPTDDKVIKKVTSKVKEMCLLFSFLLMLCVVCTVEFVTRSAVDWDKVDPFGLWLSYAFITPIGGIVIPISFFVYILYNKCSSKQEPQEMTNHPQHASEAADQDDGLIHPPGRVSVASNTEDRPERFWTCSGDTFGSGSVYGSGSATQPLLGDRKRSSMSSTLYNSIET